MNGISRMLLILLVWARVASGATWSDGFDGTDTLSSNWTRIDNAGHAEKISGNCVASSDYAQYYWSANTPTDSQVAFFIYSSGNSVGVMLRCQTTGNNNYIVVIIGGTATIYLTVGGSSSVIASKTMAMPSASDTVWGFALGTKIGIATKTDTLAVTDATFTSGRTGFFLRYQNDAVAYYQSNDYPLPGSLTQFTLTNNASAGGSFAPATGLHDSGAVFSLSASASANYHFIKYTRSNTYAKITDSSSAVSNCYLTGNSAITAVFSQTNCFVFREASINGQIRRIP